MNLGIRIMVKVLFVCIASWFIGFTMGQRLIWSDAIEAHAARINPTTGQYEWIVGGGNE